MRLDQLHNIWEDLLVSLMLLTRFPVAKYRKEQNPPNLTRAQWAFPLVGALVGFITIFIANALNYIGFNETTSSVVGVMTALLVIGAFHENGLAKVLDGFGGGAEKKQKLEIMKEGRLGTYGTLGLIISTLLKVSLITELLNTPGCFLLVMCSFSLGRTSIVILRRSSIVASGETSTTLVGKASFTQTLLAILFGTIWIIPISFSLVLIVTFVMLMLTLGLRFLALRQIGGVSGDVLGASVQIVEISVLAIVNFWFLN